MDITNKEHSTCDKSPERVEKAIHALLGLVCEDPLELPEAVLLGMHFREDVSLSFIASAGDVYELLGDEKNKLEASLFDAVALVFCGWGAPIEPAGAISELIAPSASPDRVRVRVILTAGVDGVCSSMRFANKPDGVLFDDGRGTLGDALLDFWAK